MLAWPQRVVMFWTDEVRVAARQASRERLLRRLLLVGALEVFSFWLIAQLLPGFTVSGWSAVVYGVAVIAALNAVLRPAILWLTLPFTFLTFGLLTIFINAGLLLLAGWLVEGVTIGGPVPALLGVLGLAAVNTIASSALHLGDEDSFYRHLMARAARRRRPPSETEAAGMLVVQLDGVSVDALRVAVRGGHMPTLAGWLRRGTHRVAEWECSVPSQTPTNQAGLLHGHEFDIPGFRWYEKEHGRMLVASRPADVAEISRRIVGATDGDRVVGIDGAASRGGLLAGGGSSVANLLSGDAERSVLTLSTLGDRSQTRSADLFYYYLAPYAFTRSLLMMLREVLIENAQALRQLLRGEHPRVGRLRSFPLLRAVSCVLLRDMTVALVIEDIHAGVPIVFCDFVGYDEVAHRSGPLHPDALRVLHGIDAQLASIERAARQAPRPYHVVLLSDHGQSSGVPFRHEHGETIGEVVRRLVPGRRVRLSLGSDEGWGTLNAVLTELLHVTESRATRGVAAVVRWLFRSRVRGEGVEVGPERQALGEPDADVIVCASGNLALIYVTALPGRLSLEQVEAACPGLVEGLAAHPGVGFVLGRSERDGPVAIGAAGRRFLRDDRVEGEDPLEPFGPYAAEHLRRLDAFPHTGDLIVNSRVDPFTGEVASFEEFVGSHGGLGGPQTRAFVAYPAGWAPPGASIVGASAMHAVLRGWRDALAGEAEPRRVAAEPRPIERERSA